MRPSGPTGTSHATALRTPGSPACSLVSVMAGGQGFCLTPSPWQIRPAHLCKPRPTPKPTPYPATSSQGAQRAEGWAAATADTTSARGPRSAGRASPAAEAAWMEGVRAHCTSGVFLPDPKPQSSHEKSTRQRGRTMCLTRPPQNCPGKSGEPLQPRDQKEIVTECNGVSWMGSWGKIKDIGIN